MVETKTKKIQVNFRFSPDLVAELEKFAEVAGKSTTTIVEMAIRRYLDVGREELAAECDDRAKRLREPNSSRKSPGDELVTELMGTPSLKKAKTSDKSRNPEASGKTPRAQGGKGS